MSIAVAASVCLSAALFCASSAGAGASTDYYPHVFGAPAGTITGRLTDFGLGNGSGGMTLVTASGKTVDVYVAYPPFEIDGKPIDCPTPPRHGFTPPREDCPSWPAGLRIGESIVRVPYWIGSRYGAPTKIARGFSIVRR